MQGVEGAEMPGNVPLPLYGQRGCAAVIAGLGWFGFGVELFFNIQDALVKNLPLAGYLIDYFSFFSTCRPRTHDFLRAAASGTIFDHAKRHFGACRLYYHCRRGL